MMKRSLLLCAATLALALSSHALAAEKSPKNKPADHAAALRQSYGTYNGEPRTKDGRVDIDRLLSELTDLKVNTYNWLVWHAPTDWDDLQKFLPRAREKGIRVWVTLVPPSESPPHTKLYSEPFKIDYQKWAVEIAKLGLREKNLVAWSVDDFVHNLKTFTPEEMKKTLDAAHAVNPKLAFVPCVYYKQLTPDFAKQYGPLMDGVLFPYRHESVKADLKSADTVEKEVARFRELLGPKMPIIVDVYASAHAQLGPSTPAYVEQVIIAGHKYADGVHIYCHQDSKSEKYAIIKKLFNAWAEKK
jgi:hypothetical protein